MLLRSLRVEGLRCLRDVDLAPAPGFNLLAGPNGSGKTSLLEAIHLLSHGRSFRSGGHAALTARDRSGYTVFAELDVAGAHHRIGMTRDGEGWRMRVDGNSVTALGEVIRHCASVCFEPGSHALISGGSAERRRFLDWGVFHVEHGFLDTWQRHQRALRQRNVLLRQGASDDQLLAWEVQLADTGRHIDALRQAYCERLLPRIRAEAQRLVPMLGQPELRYLRGWAASQDLHEALLDARHRDRQRGHTGIGPHRADWRLRFEHATHHDQLSRGQEKLVALACVLAQADLYASDRDDWPLICLDDLASELDQAHQQRLVHRLLDCDAQVWVTGTECPAALQDRDLRMFHVEHGRITRI